MVGIHHALSGSTGWAWLHEEVLGARWIFTPEPGRPVSEFKHDEEIAVKVVADHPITKGLADFRIHDETYGKLWLSPRLQVLLRTDHPLSDGPVGGRERPMGRLPVHDFLGQLLRFVQVDVDAHGLSPKASRQKRLSLAAGSAAA